MSSSKDGMGQGLYTSYGDLIQFYQLRKFWLSVAILK